MITPAIPTRYAGHLFRSRLEARWAAMFDLLRWPWTYEPFDLEGYIPDFLLVLEKPVLVEVKPSATLGQLRQHTAKIERTSWAGEALLLGADPIIPESDESAFVGGDFGLLAERQGENKKEWWWGPATAITCNVCNRPSFHHSVLAYACRVSGCADGTHHLEDPPDLHVLWGRAHELTRWTPGAQR